MKIYMEIRVMLHSMLRFSSQFCNLLCLLGECRLHGQ